MSSSAKRALGGHHSSLLRTTGIRTAEILTRWVHHKGYWRLVRILGRGSTESVRVDVGDGAIEVSLSDPYWARLIGSGFEYEPEVREWLESISRHEVDFIDVGANVGYWPLMFRHLFQRGRIAALEPNPVLFPGLERVCSLIPEAEAFHEAVVATPEKSVILRQPAFSGGHADGSLIEGLLEGPTVEWRVPAILLDDAVSRAARPGVPLLLKLDIEGLEATVMQVSDVLSDDMVCVLYEDHGRDQESPNTALILEQKNRRVFLLEPGLAPRRVESIEGLARFKRSTKRGYNLVAVPRRGPWLRVVDTRNG